MDEKECRELISHCFLIRKNIVEAKQWLDKRYRDAAPGESTSIEWYAKFKRDHTNTDDTERSSLPKSAVVPENITKVHKIVLGDRKLELREIADTLTISEGSVFTILHESLGMRKLFSKWMPRLLKPNQKHQGTEDSERCLELFKRGKNDFLRRYVTMDETWIHHYTPEMKRSSAEWTAAGESDRKLNSGLARLWHPHFGTCMVFCLSTILRKVKPLTVTITWHYWID